MSRALVVCLVAALAALPLAPVEHVHETDGPDGHHQVVAHSHLEDHHHPAAVAGNHHLATHVEDDDSVVLTFDRTFVAQPVHHVVEQDVEAVRYLEPPAVVRAGAPARYLQRPIHGPPRAPTGLRAPPAHLS